jgi:N-acetylglucosaminyldiphosphoundecaprenol N-acetyl-beta-D-mannosaminyltransferase
MQRYSVLNLWVDDCNMEKALEQVNKYITDGYKVYTIFASNPEKNYSVPKDTLLHEIFKKADLLIPDGIGMVLAARLIYNAHVQRVPGCELMQNICKMSADKGYKIFIYGAKNEVNEAAVNELKTRHPSIQIVGSQDGYLDNGEMDGLIDRINASNAQILFLALGSPKQEKWIAKYKDQLRNVRVCQGIGGTLDVLAGTVKRAPYFFCKMGLEWLYRLMSEPKRLKRQIQLPLFAIQVIKAKLFQK